MKLEAHGQIEWHDDHPKNEFYEDPCDYPIPINVALVNRTMLYGSKRPWTCSMAQWKSVSN